MSNAQLSEQIKSYGIQCSTTFGKSGVVTLPQERRILIAPDYLSFKDKYGEVAAKFWHAIIDTESEVLVNDHKLPPLLVFRNGIVSKTSSQVNVLNRAPGENVDIWSSAYGRIITNRELDIKRIPAKYARQIAMAGIEFCVLLRTHKVDVAGDISTVGGLFEGRTIDHLMDTGEISLTPDHRIPRAVKKAMLR